VQIHGNSKFEIGWTVAPALILVVMGFATVGTIIRFNREPKGDAVQVTVIGHQWWWEYRYPGRGVTTANELHIPTGRDVRLTVTSADVIHNYWPPKLQGKIYAVPGRNARMTVQTDEEGTYFGECAEYCGLSHANMRLRVIAESPQDFERWVTAEAAAAGQPPAGSLAGDGATLFLNKGCGGCHTVNGVSSGRVGPNLTHFQARQTFAGAIFENNTQNLRAWLRNPPDEKPGSIMPDLNLTEDEITKLIAYLETLR
jgi:cytochrome c oxidase subunit 2